MKYPLLAAAYLSLSACAPFEQKVETPIVNLGIDESVKIVEKGVPADENAAEKLSVEEKVNAILKEFMQPGDYRISGIDLSSKDLNVEIYFDICDKYFRFEYCKNSLSLMINLSDHDLNYEIFLVDSPPYGSLDYFDFCKEGGCKIRPESYLELGSELLKKIVDEGYKQVIDDHKRYSVDSKIEGIFRRLTDF